MKQTINIIAFFFVLSIPFALSSQTRKAIPAGRYEALSGVKNSRSMKTTDSSTEKRDSTILFWNEVLNHVPEETKDLTYYSTGKMDDYSTSLLATKGLKNTKKVDKGTSIIISDDLDRDMGMFKNLKDKNSLVVIKDSHQLKDVMVSMNQYEVLLYQAEEKSNFFLLKLK